MSQKYSTPVYTREVPSWVYDGLIGFGILLAAAGMLWLPWLFWLPLVLLVWGSFIEPRMLTERHIAVGEGERELRVVFLSDMHVGPYKGARWLRRLVRRTNALEPDIILLGGDFIYDASSDPAPLTELSGLKARHGVIGIMGNHDFHYQPEAVREVLHASGVRILDNASFIFSHDEARCAVTGVEDDWDANTDFTSAFRDIGTSDCVISLIHNPDLAPHAAKFRPTLILSGHVHGGQMRLPFLGPIPRLPHHLGRKYDRGVFEVDGTPLIIGQGVGESGPRARLFCPPQILELSMRF